MGEGGDWKTARRFTAIARPPAGLHEWMSDANSHHAKISFPHRSACCNFGIDTIMKYWRNVRYKLLCLQADKIFGIKRTRSLSPKPLHELTVAFRRQSVYHLQSYFIPPYRHNLSTEKCNRQGTGTSSYQVCCGSSRDCRTRGSRQNIHLTWQKTTTESSLTLRHTQWGGRG